MDDPTTPQGGMTDGLLRQAGLTVIQDPTAEEEKQIREFWADVKVRMVEADGFRYGVALIVLKDGAELLERIEITDAHHLMIADRLRVPVDDYRRLLADPQNRPTVIREVNKHIAPAIFGFWHEHALQSDDPLVADLMWELRHHSRRAHFDPLSRIRIVKVAHQLEALRAGLPATIPGGMDDFSRDSVLAKLAARQAPTLQSIQRLLDPTARGIAANAACEAGKHLPLGASDHALQRVIAGIRKLKKRKHRELMLLVWDDGLPLAEAAKHLGITYSTAYNRYVKATQLLARYGLVTQRDIEFICTQQERTEAKAAARSGIGHPEDRIYEHQPEKNSQVDRHGRTKPANPGYAVSHAPNCRCAMCMALNGRPLRPLRVAWQRGSSDGAGRELPDLTPETIAKLKAAPEDPSGMHTCSKKPAAVLALTPAAQEHADYYERLKHQAIKRGTYSGKKYTGGHNTKTEDGFGVSSGLTKQDYDWSLEGLTKIEDKE